MIAGWRTNGARILQTLYRPPSEDAQSVDLGEPLDGLEFNFAMLGDTGGCVVEVLLPNDVLVRKVLSPANPTHICRDAQSA